MDNNGQQWITMDNIGRFEICWRSNIKGKLAKKLSATISSPGFWLGEHCTRSENTFGVEPIEVKPIKVKPIKVKPIKVKPIKVEPIEVKPIKVEPIKVKSRWNQSRSKKGRWNQSR